MNVLCFAAGVIVAAILSWIVNRVEWHERRRLKSRVDNLYRHLACGAGYVGCKGGPKCEFDCQDLPLMSRLRICLAVISGGLLKLRSPSITITTPEEPEANP